MNNTMNNEEKKVLQDVHISKNDTCLTYVLKRLGLPTDFCTYITLHDKFSYYPFTAFEKKLQVGDVLIWDKDVEWDWMPTKIIGSKLIWENIPVKFHSAIFEGDNTFTDCTRLIHTPHPSLRMRMLSSIQKKPDWVLRLNN
jgi:hypothetical protein